MDEEISPKFKRAVLFVNNVKKSKDFYINILGQKILMDGERYVEFEGEFCIWDKEYALNTIYSDKAKSASVGGNNSEIYFESSNLDDFYKNLNNIGVTFIHPIHEYPWGQRAFRVFDPDNHIIEFGEPMSLVVLRYHKQEMNAEEISKKTEMPIEIIKKIIENSN